jgi:uncharacterized protein YjdB
MSRTLRILVLVSLAIILITAPVACSPGGTLQSITVDPVDVILGLNWTRQITVTANYDQGDPKDVTKKCTYNSSDTKIATVSSTGLITVGGLAAGSVTITVTYTEKEVTKMASIKVTTK